MSNEAQHMLTLTQRQSLSISGISDVGAFNEQEISAVCDGDELIIKGEQLHIEELNIEAGVLDVSGKINSLTYSEKLSTSSFFKRLFGG